MFQSRHTARDHPVTNHPARLVESVQGTGASRQCDVPPLAIATAQLLQVLADPSVKIALPSIEDELAATPAHLPWTVNAGRRDDDALQALQAWERKPPHPSHHLNP